MPPIDFPYKIYRDAHCPIIRLEISYQNRWIETEAYVDSGASISLFSVIEAQRLKIDYSVGFNLLGRKDIFEHFDITFSDSNETISFNPIRER